MSLFGDIGNIFHSIGHFFNNGDHNNNQPQYQPPNVNSILTGRVVAPNGSNNNQNNQNNSSNNNQNQQQPPQTPSVNLYQGPLKKVNPNPNDPNLPFLQHVQQINTQADQPPANTADRAINTVADSVARSVVGVPQGISQLYDLISPGHGTNRLTKVLNNGAEQVDQDQAKNGLQGRVGSDVYHGLQVAENVIPGAAEAIAKAPALIDGGVNLVKNAPTLIKTAVPDILANAPAKIASVAGQAGDAISGAGQTIDRLMGMPEQAGVLNKIAPTDAKIAAGIQQPDEVVPGIKSVNPNQANDALAHVQQKEAEAAANPAPQPAPGETVQPANANPQDANANPQAPAPAPPHPDVMNENEAATLAQLNKDAKTRVLSTDEKNTRSALQAKADHIDQSNNPETPQNAAQTPNVEPQPPVNAPTAPNAPNIRAQAQKDLESIGQQVDKNINDTVPKNASPDVGDAKVHEVLSNEQLNGAADRYVQSMSDEELKNALQNGMPVNGAGDIAKAYSAVKRLGKMAAAGDEEAKGLIPKILDSVEQHVSGAGRSMNYTGSMLDSLPKEAQLEYIVKDINKTRAAAGLEPLSDEEELNARSSLTKYLTEIEDKQDAAAGAQGKIEEIMARAEKGEASPDEIKQIAEYQKSAEQNTRDANQLKTQVGKEYLQYAPQKGNFAKNAGDFARSSMLTKVTGRLSDVATTGLNVIHSLTQSSLEAGMGKVLNKVGDTPGKFQDTMPNVKAMVQGTGKGARDLTSNYKGNVETPDLYSAIRQKGMGGKSQLMSANSGNRVSQFVRKAGHAMAETATNLSEGVGANRINEMAMQEGKQMGLEGDQLKVWAAGRAAAPTPEMARAGKQLVDEVNNMNDNKLTELMDRLSKAFTGSKMGNSIDNSKLGKLAEFGGEQVRNIVAPFTRWAAGAAWNGATDKNAVANVVKIAQQLSFKDGKLAVADPQELVHQIAGLATNTAGAMGAGYALASHGMLTSSNAEGYNDEGMYLHLGGHYIPVGFLGFFAPGIVMGAATHQAVHDNTPGKSVVEKIVQAAGKTFGALGRSDLTNTMIGGSNEFVKQIQQAFQNRQASFSDAGATGATDAAGSYIPGIAGDANTAINTFNLGGLNPNHETALTKVTKGETGVLSKNGSPSTAKDVPRSDVNQLINKVPVLGQEVLPRKPGVAAPDFGSAITRGDNESASQAADNKAIASLPANQQQGVRNALLKTDGAARIAAQKAADAQPGGLTKINAQQVADKLNFNSAQGPLETAIANAKQSDAVGAFKGSNKQVQTIGDKTYANINGQTKTFDTPQQAQQAIDAEKFKASGQKSATINGTMFQRGSDGKITHMDQKDFDYKTANDQITSSKNSGDVSNYTDGISKLLGNIGWQLNHADLTQAQRDQLTQKAVQTQEDYAKTQQYGGFEKPKGVDTYKSPEFVNAHPGYVKTIQEMGAKYGLDINALLSVAAQEGLGGGVGDSGHAFGPFQMNDAGGVLTGKFKSSAEAQKYAESPQGIEDAIKQIATVAKGKVGADAIKAIVTQFERSADQPGEIAKALAVYNGGKAVLSNNGSGASSIDTSNSSGSGSSGANLVKENNVGSLLQPSRENFINDLAARPIALSIPQIKLTSPQSLIKAHKITVGMPKA